MPIITISRGSLSGGEVLAQNLGTKLGLKVISREVIIEAAQKYGVSESDLIKGLESPPGLWERLIGNRERYILAIQATLAEMVEDGHIVYHGIAGQFLLQELPNVMKVRLIAPIEYRLRAAMVEHGMTRDDAIKHITTADMLRAQWVRRLYNAEWTDPSLYDVVINLAHMDIDTATQMLADLANGELFRETEANQQAVHDFALATRVRAALRFNSSFPEDGINVAGRNGAIHLSGPKFDSNRHAIVDFVKKVPGVTHVTPDTSSNDQTTTSDLSTRIGQTAADVMVPINGYPHIQQSVTIREAMMALGASSVVLQDGHLISPRYVIVFDEDDRVVGVIGRRNLLRGLTPHLTAIAKARASVESVAPLAEFSMPVTLDWNALFSTAAVSASWEPVKTIMAPIRGTVHVDDSLSTVVTTMIHHSIDVVPVVNGNRAVGVILMTDVFDTVAQYIMEQGAQKPEE